MKTTVITMGTLIRKQVFNNGLRKVTLALKERVADKLISRYISGIVTKNLPQSIFEDMKEGNVFIATGSLTYSQYEDEAGREKSSLEPSYLNFVPVSKDDLEFEADNAGNLVLVGGINEVTLDGGLTKDVEYKDVSKSENSYQLTTGRVVWEEEFQRGGRDTVIRKHYANFELWGDEAVRYATLAKGQRVVLRGGIVNDSFDGEGGEKVYLTKIGVTQLIPCERNFRGTAPHVAPHAAEQPPHATHVKAEDVTGVI
jgi:single-stranded DNA-binding protein